MRDKTLSFLGKINFGRFFAIFFISALLVLANAHGLSAADVSANLTIDSVHFYKDDARTKEITAMDGIYANGAAFLAEINWTYNSEMPIMDGDIVTFAFGNKITNTGITMPDSDWVDILDEDNNKLGQWMLSNKKITIRFSGAAVGHYILNGSIRTARNMVLTGMRASDVMVDFAVAGKDYSFLKAANTNMGTLSDKSVFYAGSASNKQIVWEYMTPGITVNELYKGNGRTELSEKAVFSNLIFENEVNPNASSAVLTIYARAPIPKNLTDGAAGGGGTGSWYSVKNLFREKSQAEGQSYEDFRASLDELEYGFYHYKDGRTMVVVRIGKQPSDRIKYSDLYGSKGAIVYGSLPEATETFRSLSNNIVGGGVAQFVVDVTEKFDTALNGGTRIVSDPDYLYDDNSNAIAFHSSVIIPVGSGTAAIIGEARLRLVDADTNTPLPGREFILQEQDGDEWKDLENTRRTTDADGRIQVIGLTPGKNYRWQQISFADHYDKDSLKIKQDQQVMRRGTSTDGSNFTMPTNAGISFTATNARQTYKVTYTLGDGSDDEDIIFEQAYGETTKQPDMDTVNINDGYTFEGWNRDIANTVTEDITYTARWSAVLGARRGQPSEPESVKTNNPELPSTYDPISRYVAILACSLTLSLYFAPGALRAYRVNKYRK